MQLTAVYTASANVSGLTREFATMRRAADPLPPYPRAVKNFVKGELVDRRYGRGTIAGPPTTEVEVLVRFLAAGCFSTKNDGH
jgi:hypothetical protein